MKGASTSTLAAITRNRPVRQRNNRRGRSHLLPFSERQADRAKSTMDGMPTRMIERLWRSLLRFFSIADLLPLRAEERRRSLLGNDVRRCDQEGEPAPQEGRIAFDGTGHDPLPREVERGVEQDGDAAPVTIGHEEVVEARRHGAVHRLYAGRAV